MNNENYGLVFSTYRSSFQHLRLTDFNLVLGESNEMPGPPQRPQVHRGPLQRQAAELHC